MALVDGGLFIERLIENKFSSFKLIEDWTSMFTELHFLNFIMNFDSDESLWAGECFALSKHFSGTHPKL